MRKEKKLTREIENEQLFLENEEQANHYVVVCLRMVAAAAALMWLLNLLHFFVVDQLMMNIIMPFGIFWVLLPSFLEKVKFRHPGRKKYFLIICFLICLTSLSCVLTMHMIPFWMCAIILACNYYSPRFTLFVLIGTLIGMLISLYVGLLIGVWDSNMMHMNQPDTLSIASRLEIIEQARLAGDNILLRIFNFYYLPRAVAAVVVYLICRTLTRRTHELLEKQAEIMTESERISAELSVATQIQSSMLPCIFPAFPSKDEFDIYASMTPAKEVGGDFYDFFMVDETHLAIVIADVSGKGVPAALFMVIGKTLIKDHTTAEKDLGEVFSEVNRMLCEANSQGLFITAFEGVLDINTGKLTFVNAGHEMPFITRDGRFVPQKIKPGFVLAGLDEYPYRSGSFQLAPGDKLFQYTDGVTEATDAENQLYGMERLEKTLNRCVDETPEHILEFVRKDVDAFVGTAPQFDDITMLCLEYRGADKQ